MRGLKILDKRIFKLTTAKSGRREAERAIKHANPQSKMGKAKHRKTTDKKPKKQRQALFPP
jgi:hypothetical protein